jgi:cyclic pyranopterin phosphate synthase
MVDVGAKPTTHRVAVAEVYVRMKPETLELLASGASKVTRSVARIADPGCRAPDLILLAHPTA